jgi:hypothetical protein
MEALLWNTLVGIQTDNYSAVVARVALRARTRCTVLSSRSLADVPEAS